MAHIFKDTTLYSNTKVQTVANATAALANYNAAFMSAAMALFAQLSEEDLRQIVRFQVWG